MSFGGGPTGFEAIKALVDSQADFRAVADKDWAAAAGLIVKKLLNAAGQTAESLIALRAAVGEEIFEAQLKSLSHYQAKLLAKRLDKSVPDLEVSTARAAIAWIRTLLAPAAEIEAPKPEAEPEPETEVKSADPSTDESVTEQPTDDTPPASPNPYFGRKS
ncbi:MAG: hypothetical protein ACK4P2_05270, partial [Hyphomonas sp.]